jgi:hypothetical protein
MKMKRTHLTTLTSLLLFGLLAFSARAGIVLQDNFSYPDGVLTNQAYLTLGYPFWFVHSGNLDLQVSSGHAVIAGSSTVTGDDSAYLTNWPYGVGAAGGTNGLGNQVGALYASFTINVSGLPTGAATYFAHFKDAGGGTAFRARIYAVTNGATSGSYRVAIGNNSGTQTNINTDLSLGTTYSLVVRYVLSTGVATLWLNPTSETNSNPAITATGTDTPTTANAMSMFAMRQSTGEGVIALDNLVVGTSFADVVPGSINPPSIVLQPVDNLIAVTNDSITFSAAAVGDQPITYRWFYNTNTPLADSATVTGSATNLLVLSSVTTNMSGYYSCVASNVAGTNVTRLAQLLVYPAPVPVAITNQPQSLTLFAGDTATFSVAAGGVPPPTYQWSYITNNGAVSKTNFIAGATNSTLTLANVATNIIFTNLFVTVANRVNTTNSALAVLKVNPPPVLTIAQLRAKVDGSFAPTNTTAIFAIQGIVTTWTNMTSSSASSEFYIQDSSAGIVVFWSGAAASTNLPPAGAMVTVTGPLAAFHGLLEISPVFTNTLHGVTINSTNNPLPAAQPLPFDPNVTGSLATMKAMESMYFVASNVMLNLSAPNFVSSANDTITNNVYHTKTFSSSALTVSFTNDVGQTFILFINSGTDIPNKPKSTGPVTIYGVLGYFDTAGYEFTPSRFADIISYFSQSNVVSHAVRSGDLLTNTYTESRLLTGETLTTRLTIGDPEGGNVTLAPASGGLPGSASWSNVTGGQTGTAVFHFTPTAADAGSNYVVSVGVSSTSGNSFSNAFTVYVPTTNEQQIAVSEFLANPTTNTLAPNFNPLRRSTDTVGISTNDQYIEIANESPNGMYLFGWAIYNTTGSKVEDFSLDAPTVASSNAIVVYGGPADQSVPPNLAVYNEPATSKSLRLATSGTGTIVLRNQNGNIIDRVIYSGSDLNTNGSLTRFPDNINGPFVPQPYVSTNLTTPGLPYDGGAWTRPFKVPAGVNNVGINAVNGQVLFNFTANTGLASTLWGADAVNGPFRVLNGRQFPTTSGAFTNPAPAAPQFYFISTQ